MAREDEDDISDCDEAQTVKAARILGCRDRPTSSSITTGMAEARSAGNSSSSWNSCRKRDGSLVSRKEGQRSAVSALQDQREASRRQHLDGRLSSSATAADREQDGDEDPADPFGKFMHGGRSALHSPGGLKPAGAQKRTAGKTAVQDWFKGRNQSSHDNSFPPQTTNKGSSGSSLKLKVLLKPFEAPRQAPAATAPASGGSQLQPKRRSALGTLSSHPGNTGGKASAEDAMQELQDSPAGGSQTNKRRGKVLDDSSEDEEPSARVKQEHRKVKFQRSTAQPPLRSIVGGAPAKEPGPSPGWIPKKSRGVDEEGAKMRMAARQFFVPTKQKVEVEPDQTPETIENETDTLEDDDVEVADPDVIKVARGTPVRARLRKRKAETREADDLQQLLVEDFPGESDPQSSDHLRRKGGRRAVIVDEDEEELCDAAVQSGGSFSDGQEDETPGWRLQQEENVDPVTAALRKCEAIATALQRKLREGAGDMQPATEDSENPSHGDVSCFNRVDDSGAKLVTQEDIAEACGSKVQLKPYQLVGVNFLLLLSRQGVGGAILADEMGLGKTVQAISFLAVLAHLDRDHGPHLVVAPASLLENWQREIKRWCPDLEVVLLHGAEREETRMKVEQCMGFGRGSRLLNGGAAEGGKGKGGLHFNVMLTCYSLFERDSAMQKDDRKFLRKFDFSCVLMDEAHLLKDRKSQRTTRLRNIASRARHRLMLTGTPLQNDLTELWCLLELLHPSIFGTGDTSDQVLAEHLSDRSIKDSLIDRMKTILAPFVLRRMKGDVMRQLSPKIQEVRMVEMLPEQVELYAEALENCRSAIKKSSEEAVSKKRKARQGITVDGLLDLSSVIPKKQIASLFTHLRKVANHPLLVRSLFSDKVMEDIAPIMHRAGVFGFECSLERVKEELLKCSDFEIDRLCQGLGGESPSGLVIAKHALNEADFMRSAKCQTLAQLLPQLKGGGHRPLIFSQWTSVLDILERVLHYLGLSYVRLDGSTQVTERQELVDQFNGDESIFAFLLSTRAGGQGLNLTGADTVILHDVDFNPQMDRQAEDRAHRIGQTRPVTIIRMVCQGTVDENILRIADRKLSLDAAILSGSSAPTAGDETSSMAAVLTSLFKDAMQGPTGT